MGFPGEPGRDGNRGPLGISGDKGVYLSVCVRERERECVLTSNICACYNPDKFFQ
jgi:hypothetical protein